MVYNRIQGFLSYFFNSSSVNNTEAKLIDLYLEKVSSILTWKSLDATLRTFFWLNSIFWIIIMLDLRVYGIIGIMSLHLFVYDIWKRDTLYLEYKGEYSGPISDIQNIIINVINILKSLRKDSPLMFCSSMALFFMMLRILASNISGLFLSYLLFLITFAVHPCFTMLPENVTQKIMAFISSLRTLKCNVAEDELIPFIEGKDFDKNDADLESLLTDRTADSVTNSLVSGISSMPSYLEIAETPRDIEEDDLLPRGTSQGISLTPGELSSDSDSDNREIRFDSDHFNTSSSDDDPYCKNLDFPKEGKEICKDESGLKNMFSSVMASVSDKIVPNMFRSSINAKTSFRNTVSDSDSDFEIVDGDDFSDFKPT